MIWKTRIYGFDFSCSLTLPILFSCSFVFTTRVTFGLNRKIYNIWKNKFRSETNQEWGTISKLLLNNLYSFNYFLHSRLRGIFPESILLWWRRKIYTTCQVYLNFQRIAVAYALGFKVSLLWIDLQAKGMDKVEEENLKKMEKYSTLESVCKGNRLSIILSLFFSCMTDIYRIAHFRYSRFISK